MMLPGNTSIAARSGVAEWEERAQTLLRQVEVVLDLTAAPYRIWARNDLDSFIADTSPGTIVESGTLYREETLMIHQLFLAVIAFVSTPIEVYRDEQDQPVTMTPEQIIGYRRIPEMSLGGATAKEGLLPVPGRSAITTSLPRSAPGHNGFSRGDDHV